MLIVYRDDRILEQAKEIKSLDILIKPFGIRELEKSIELAFSGRGGAKKAKREAAVENILVEFVKRDNTTTDKDRRDFIGKYEGGMLDGRRNCYCMGEIR